MTTKYVPLGPQKLDLICDTLQLDNRNGPGYRRTGELAVHVCRAVPTIDESNRKTLQRQIQRMWSSDDGEISGPQFELLKKGLGINKADLDWFLSEDLGKFSNRIASHRFPKPSGPANLQSLSLSSEAPKHYLSVDLATIDVFASEQQGFEFPIIKLYFSLIQIPEEHIAYGFRSILVSFEFEDGSSICLVDRVGDGALPYRLDCDAVIVARRTKFDPLFELRTNDAARPLSIDEYSPAMGRLLNATEGDTFTVRVRAELTSDVIQLVDGDGSTQEQLMELQRLVLRKQLRRSAGTQDLQLTGDGQFIELASQTVSVEKRNEEL